jgi:hypothetical protein
MSYMISPLLGSYRRGYNPHEIKVSRATTDNLALLQTERYEGSRMYRLELKSVSRGKGASVIAKAAYHARIKLRDERQALIHDYSAGRSVVVSAGVLLPPGAPAWMKDREKLWNAIDAIEKRKDSETAKSLTLTLPRDVSRNDRIRLVFAFVKENILDRGFVADAAIHSEIASDGERNEHAHILYSERPVDPNSPTGFASKKDLSKRGPEFVYELREAWEKQYNQCLLLGSSREGSVTCRAEWKRVRDRLRETSVDAPVAEKMAAVAVAKEFETRPAKTQISGGEYQAGVRRPASGYERRQRAARAWRALVGERRQQIQAFQAGLRRAFPFGGISRKVNHLAAEAVRYFDRLMTLQRGDRLPPVPFDSHGFWRRAVPARVLPPISSPVLWKIWRSGTRSRAIEQKFEREVEREHPPPQAPPPPERKPVVPVRRPVTFQR